MVTRNETPTRTNRFLGLQDAKSARAVGREGFMIADNVDINNDLEVERRPGRTQVRSGAVDAVWGDGSDLLFTASNKLYRLEANESEVVLASGLTTSSILAIARAGDRLYWSNSYETGVVVGNNNRSLGLPVPAPPSVASVGGTLPKGLYAFSVSFMRSDNQESGLSLETLVNLTSDGGFSISIPATSTDSDVTHVSVYASAPNGRQMYLLTTVKLGAAAVSFDDSTRRLGTYAAQFEHAEAIPAFHCAAVCNARLIVGAGEFLYYSPPYAYELMDRRFNYIPFQSRVEIIAPVDGGTFVGTGNSVLFLRGDISDASDVRVVAGYGVVRGSHPMPLENHEIRQEDFVGNGVLLLTKRGYALCLDGGRFINVTEGEAVFPAAPVLGGGVIRRINGTVHALSVVKS